MSKFDHQKVRIIGSHPRAGEEGKTGELQNPDGPNTYLPVHLDKGGTIPINDASQLMFLPPLPMQILNKEKRHGER